MVLIGQPLGMYAPNFFPEKAGRDYEPSRYLKLLQPSAISSPFSPACRTITRRGTSRKCGLMTGVAPEFIRDRDIKNGVSLDQEAASPHRQSNAIPLTHSGRRE